MKSTLLLLFLSSCSGLHSTDWAAFHASLDAGAADAGPPSCRDPAAVAVVAPILPFVKAAAEAREDDAWQPAIQMVAEHFGVAATVCAAQQIVSREISAIAYVRLEIWLTQNRSAVAAVIPTFSTAARDAGPQPSKR
jgi:hypothetical protein